MDSPRVVAILKRDVFGRVERLEGPRGPAVRRVACGSRLPGSRWLARILLRRERAALARLEGLPGTTQRLEWPEYARAPSVDGRVPRAREVTVRSWCEGVPLYAAAELPADFFDRLEELVRRVHERGVCHNDLHKEPNILVAADGRPHLIDLQLASIHPRPSRTRSLRASEDLRHVDKHRRRYQSQGHPVEATPAARRRSWIATVWMRCVKPAYNALTRRLLRRSDAEPRRPRGGPWPVWTSPVGPRRP